MTTPGDLMQRAKQQRDRRMARRVCGNCEQPAESMIDWGKQQLAICHGCRERLTGDIPDWPLIELGQGPRCPIGTHRPCYDCTREEAPTAEEDSVPRGRSIFRSLFGKGRRPPNSDPC